MKLYIDASPIQKEDRQTGTLCTLLIKDGDVQLLTKEAPPSRNELEAKYFALEKGLGALESRGFQGRELTVFTDCWMIVNQLQGRYDVKDPVFIRHKRLVEDLMTKLGSVQVRYIPKKENLAHTTLEDRLR